MSNRVEELESKVAELQAAINGLTEELVETKERVRQLEEEAKAEPASSKQSADSGSTGFAKGADGDVGAEVSNAADNATAGAGAGARDDEEAKADESEGTNDEGESGLGDSDIIVA